MSLIVRLFALFSLALPGALAAAGPQAAQPMTESCLYPSTHERFGVTGTIVPYDVTQLNAGIYHDWWANSNPTHPGGMHYHPVVQTSMDGYYPSGQELERAVLRNLGATWGIGNEADTIWINNTTPEVYAEQYHDVYTLIKGLDPTAKFAVNSLATVSPLRLEWLERALASYRDRYGTEMPVDVWNVHTYFVNEMVHEWGPQIPPGIDNVVAYALGTWTETTMSGASGGSVHQSRLSGARAYFAFQGSQATLYLMAGPDGGQARIYVDTLYRETVDLYAPQYGAVTRTYALPHYSNPNLQDWHHVRIDPSGRSSAPSTDAWVRVDAVEAESTASLPSGRLENDHPVRARIVTNAHEYANLSRLEEQLLMFRQWMADNGQRNKPLINSEFGVLMGTDQGFGYDQVSSYMLSSFDYFINDAIHPTLGMPDDGNHLLQQWFWYKVAGNYFNGTRNYSGLFDPQTRQILPLGQDYANYVEGLVTHYADLEITPAQLEVWNALFAGEPNRLQLDAQIHNRGNIAAGPFRVSLAMGSTEIRHWDVPGLSAAFDGNSTYDVGHAWQALAPAGNTVSLTADNTAQVDEPCDSNNVFQTGLAGSPHPDLAVGTVTMTPPNFWTVPPGTTPSASFEVEVVNLGSVGTADRQVIVRLWDGHPSSGGTLIGSGTLHPGTGPQDRIQVNWPNISGGAHQVMVEVRPASEETNTQNNWRELDVHVPVGEYRYYLPRTRLNGGGS